jgi:hypothetical protein
MKMNRKNKQWMRACCRGFPLWLHFIPGIKFRTDNEPFKAEMQRFTTKVVDTMKGAGLYASQGGPIILSQVHSVCLIAVCVHVRPE